MPKTFITFGQSHTHRVNNKTFDCDCVAAIESNDEYQGRAIAFELFGPKWHNSYFGSFPEDKLHFFPRGIIDVD